MILRFFHFTQKDMINLIRFKTSRSSDRIQKIIEDFLNETGNSNVFYVDELENDLERFSNLEKTSIFILFPEWNGSFPWQFKKFIDCIPKDIWRKKFDVHLISFSTSSSGGILALSHLSDIFSSLECLVKSRIYVQSINTIEDSEISTKIKRLNYEH